MNVNIIVNGEKISGVRLRDVKGKKNRCIVAIKVGAHTRRVTVNTNKVTKA
jgi:hypothetical protein